MYKSSNKIAFEHVFSLQILQEQLLQQPLTARLYCLSVLWKYLNFTTTTNSRLLFVQGQKNTFLTFLFDDKWHVKVLLFRMRNFLLLLVSNDAVGKSQICAVTQTFAHNSKFAERNTVPLLFVLCRRMRYSTFNVEVLNLGTESCDPNVFSH